MRVIDLIGVVEDGTQPATRSLLAPVNPRQTISYTQGETLLIRYTLLTASGQRVDLSKDGAVLTLTIRKVPLPAGSKTKDFAALLPTPQEVGRADFLITPQDLPANRVMWGRYTYDVTLSRTSTGIDKPTPLSPFVIEPGETQGASAAAPTPPAGGGTPMPAYVTTTIQNASLPGSSTTTIVAQLPVPAGNYVILAVADIAVAGEGGAIDLDRCRILTTQDGVLIQQRYRIDQFGGDLVLHAATTLAAADTIEVTIRNVSLTAGTVHAVTLIALSVDSIVRV